MFQILMTVFLSVAFASENNTIDFGTASGGRVDMNKECSSYTDCFNCTLSNCEWAGFANACTVNPGADYSKILDIKVFFAKSRSCGDPLNICGGNAPAVNKTMKFDVVNFNRNTVYGDYLPAGYFCQYDESGIIINRDKVNSSGEIYFNMTSPSDFYMFYKESYNNGNRWRPIYDELTLCNNQTIYS